MSREPADDLVERAEEYDRCWLEGRPEDLRQFLHPDVVFAGPQFQRLAHGIDACVRSYVDFLSAARIHDCTASDRVVDLAGDSAVMTYRWTIDYEISGSRSLESGQDLLVWVKRGDRWEIFWRAQLPSQP
jgi:ketosteroid isomerase-like protein